MRRHAPLTPERSLKEIFVTLAIFMMAGFGISVVGIVGGALLDDSLRFPIDVVYGLNLPVLTMIADRPVGVTNATSVQQTMISAMGQRTALSLEQPYALQATNYRIARPSLANQHVASQQVEPARLVVKDGQKRKSIFG